MSSGATTWKLSGALPLAFLWWFHYLDMIKSLATGPWPTSSLSPLFPKRHFINISSGVVERGFLWVSRHLNCSSCVVHVWLQHTRLPSPSLSPRICSHSSPLSQWCYLTIWSSVTLFSCLQSFPASWSFLVSWLFASGGQSIGASVSASVLPMNMQGWFPLGLTGLISLQSKGLSRVFSNTTVQRHQFFSALSSLWFSSHIHTWLVDKNRSFDYTDLCQKSYVSDF